MFFVFNGALGFGYKPEHGQALAGGKVIVFLVGTNFSTR